VKKKNSVLLRFVKGNKYNSITDCTNAKIRIDVKAYFGQLVQKKKILCNLNKKLLLSKIILDSYK